MSTSSLQSRIWHNGTGKTVKARNDTGETVEARNGTNKTVKMKMAQVRQSRSIIAQARPSRPDFGLGFQVKVLKISRAVPSWVSYFAEM